MIFAHETDFNRADLEQQLLVITIVIESMLSQLDDLGEVQGEANEQLMQLREMANSYFSTIKEMGQLVTGDKDRLSVELIKQINEVSETFDSIEESILRL